jgi:hypothetical protein
MLERISYNIRALTDDQLLSTWLQGQPGQNVAVTAQNWYKNKTTDWKTGPAYARMFR